MKESILKARSLVLNDKLLNYWYARLHSCLGDSSMALGSRVRLAQQLNMIQRKLDQIHRLRNRWRGNSTI